MATITNLPSTTSSWVIAGTNQMQRFKDDALSYCWGVETNKKSIAVDDSSRLWVPTNPHSTSNNFQASATGHLGVSPIKQQHLNLGKTTRGPGGLYVKSSKPLVRQSAIPVLVKPTPAPFLFFPRPGSRVFIYMKEVMPHRTTCPIPEGALYFSKLTASRIVDPWRIPK